MTQAIRVLVVDDEEHIRLAVSRVIGRMGCQVQDAKDGESALDIVASQDIDLVFLDLKMPGLDGLEVQRRIRAVNASILVIIITGYATLETAIEAMKQGAYDFIPKPFSVDQLRVITRRALDWIEMSRERQRLEEEKHRTLFDLATEKSRVRTIVESLPNGVLVTNRDGLVVLMNRAAREYLDTDLAVGQPLQEHIQHQDLYSFLATQQVNHLQQNEVPDFDFQNAQGKYLLVKIRPIPGDDGESLGQVIILVDVTPIKRLDLLKSEFVAKVSHELRSPLATIHEQMAFVIQDMLEEQSSDLDQEILTRAREKTRGLIALVEDLLDLSKLEAGLAFQDIQPVDVGELLHRQCAFLTDQAREKKQSLELSIQQGPALPFVPADPKALESIFSNLITNALKYTPEGGKVEVRVRSEVDRVLVEIQDTGFGIAPEDQSRIFERFYRVKNEQTRFITGTGLGLAIVKGILDDLGGEISLESTPGGGSTFTVSLPAQG